MDNNNRWNNLFNAFFIDYNNGFEKTFQMFKIEKQKETFDWKQFINKIKTYAHGCGSEEFQQALQDNNIYFIAGPTYTQKRYNKFMEFNFNKNHFITLEHNNIGNY